MVNRIFNPLKTKSFFLFGARGTGKSTYLKEQLGLEFLYFDLLDPVLEDRLIRHPEDLPLLIEKSQNPEWIVIDEIQRSPRLLDIVHRTIESKKNTKFILTGSNARKLKRGAANLLAGRALVYHLHPFVDAEIGSLASLDQVLQFGSLPSSLLASTTREKKSFLESYSLTYIKEEVIAEQLLRRLDPFRNFLRIVAEQSGLLINHSALGKQIGVDHKTVVNYFSILEDTLLGFYLPSFHTSIRKSQIVAPKFFLFDVGIKNSLSETIDLTPSPRTSYYGKLFEHYLILECFRLNSYAETGYRMSYFSTKAGFEIDLILSRAKQNIFIGFKSTQRIDPAEVNHLKENLKNDKQVTSILYVSQDDVDTKINGVRCLHWRTFLREFFPVPPSS